MKHKKKTPTPRRVEVTWIDACHAGGWESLQEHLTDKSPTLKSMGYLLQTKPDVRLVMSRDCMDGGTYSDRLVIPAAWVTKMRTLR